MFLHLYVREEKAPAEKKREGGQKVGSMKRRGSNDIVYRSPAEKTTTKRSKSMLVWILNFTLHLQVKEKRTGQKRRGSG